MHNLSSVYFVEKLYMFRPYLQPIIRRYTVRIQQLVPIVLFRYLLLSWLCSNLATKTDIPFRKLFTNFEISLEEVVVVFIVLR